MFAWGYAARRLLDLVAERLILESCIFGLYYNVPQV